MKHVVYCLQFKGTAAPGSDPGVMRVTTTATSALVSSIIGADGFKGAFSPTEGSLAFFESEVRMTGDGAFTESGSIAFGDDHSLTFTTIGQGHITPGPDPDSRAGVILWKIEGGEGQFAGASGHITSNFMASNTGEVVDYQLGLIFLK